MGKSQSGIRPKQLSKSPKNKKKIAPWKEAVPRWLARLIFLAAVWSLIVGLMNWLMPPIANAVSGFLFLFGLPSDFSILNAVVLFVLANSIRHRRRLALWIEIIYFQFTSILFGLIEFILYISGLELSNSIFDILTTILGVFFALFLVIVLIAARQAFPTKVISGTWWRALGIVVLGFALSIFLGLLLSFVIYRRSLPLLSQLGRVFSIAMSDFRYLLPYGTDIFDAPKGMHIALSTLILIIMLAAFALAFYQFIRSGQRDLSNSGEAELNLRKLLLEYGQHDSLGYFATRRDKTVMFSKNGKAAIAYSLFGGVLLASGDPIGEKSSWRDAGQRFLEMARFHGWTPAVVGVSAEGAKFYRRLGLSATLFGDEAVVIVKNFSLENPELREVIKVMRRAEREKYKVLIRRQSQIPAEELAQLIEDVDVWRNDGPERGFSMASSRFGDPTDERVMIVTAHDKSGSPMGILSFVPVGDRGLSLDAMRRSPKAMNGVTTFMIASLIDKSRRTNIEEISLNFAAFRRVFVNGEQVHANPIERAARRVMLLFSKWYQLESLYRSNEVYLPEWRPRWICMDRGASPTEVLLAIGQAEGFVPVDIFSRVTKFFRHQISEPQKTWWTEASFIEKVHADEASLEKANETTNLYAEERLEKLSRLEKIGICPYPLEIENSRPLQQVIEEAENSSEFNGDEIRIFGRIISLRNRGALCFADLQEKASKIQLMLKRNVIDEKAAAAARLENFERWKENISVGDFVLVSGSLMRTKTGELSLDVSQWQIAAKALETSQNLTQEENVKAVIALENQSKLLAKARTFLQEQGYQEIEGPVIAGLSRGMSKVFQIDNKLTALELFANPQKQLDLTKAFLRLVNKDFEVDLPRISIYQAISQAYQQEINAETSLEDLQELADKINLEWAVGESAGTIVFRLYQEMIKKGKSQSAFYVDFPIEAEIEARSQADKADRLEKWELVAFGKRLAAGSILLTNPVELCQRLEESGQVLKGNFLSSIETGLPSFGKLEFDLSVLLKCNEG